MNCGTISTAHVAHSHRRRSRRSSSHEGFSEALTFLYDQNQLGGDALSGKVKLNVEPLPTSLSTQIFPPCSSTNFLAKVNPSPVPSLLCAESPPTWRNSSKIFA